jgi:circadian clock protein KaiB
MENDDKFILQLYVAGMSKNSMLAVENIRRICDECLAGHFELEIIDIYKNPTVAEEQQIVFSPSLIKILPLPRKVLIGRFTDREKVMRGLGITI